MIEVGAVSLGWSGTPLDQVFEELAAMGGTCVEINGNTARHHGVALDADAIPQILHWAEWYGLAIRSLSGYCDFAQADATALEIEVERLLVTCRAAAEMKAPIVRAFVGDVKPGIDLATVRPHIVTAFRTACREAAALGITLGIENHGRLINDGPALVDLVVEVGADNLGFTLDTGNFAWAGHDAAQVRADFAAVLPYVVSVHIKDGTWTDDGFTFVPAGEGELPLAWLLEQLVAIDYAGPIYSEFEGAGDFREGTRASIAFLQRTLNEIQG
ncbi:MAG: sugar phosphate isomerase/epimerase family protein [Anaerolineae bacterium]